MLLCIGTGTTVDAARPHEVLLRRVLHEDGRGDGRSRSAAPTPRRSPTRSRSPRSCDVEIEFGKIILPMFDVPEDKTEDELPARAVHRGPQGALRRPHPAEVARAARPRARRSSATRASRRTSSSSQDFIALGQGAAASASGPGRGCAAGSIIATRSASRTSTRSSTGCSSSASSTPSAPRCPISTSTSTTSAAARSSSTCATSTATTRSRRSSRSAR